MKVDDEQCSPVGCRSDDRLPTFEPPVPQLDLISRFTVELAGEPWQLGRATDLGNHRIIPITGGYFRGPILSGEILNNGADWQVVTADGTTILDTRYLLKTHDNSLSTCEPTAFGTARPGSRRVGGRPDRGTRPVLLPHPPVIRPAAD